ncbi:MAG: pilus assembly protein PilP [Syntrophales bacterium]
MKKPPKLLMAGLLVLLLFPGGFDCFAAKRPSKNTKRSPTKDSRIKPSAEADPFLSFVEKELWLKERATKAARVSIFPLQKAGIEKFKLVGIIGDAKRRLAIVETADGKGRCYPLALGTIIGLNKGRVVRIEDDLVVVEEAVPGRTGQIVKTVIKKLHIDEEEGAS